MFTHNLYSVSVLQNLYVEVRKYRTGIIIIIFIIIIIITIIIFIAGFNHVKKLRFAVYVMNAYTYSTNIL